jgi:TetR/AcrR family transcriptional regulator
VASPRDPDRTRSRILRAAIREFAAKGFAGARVDAIAKRARINKRMLYHYFGDKRGLFRAAVTTRLSGRHAAFLAAPDALEERLPYHFALMGKDSEWMRLMLWEALTYGERPTIAEEERRAATLESLSRLREAGKLASDLDPEMGLLALAALCFFPWAFPQVTRFVTGENPSSARFKREYGRLLERVGSRLAAPPAVLACTDARR